MFETILLLGLVALLTFRLGYYIGHQIGRTEHLRNYLAETRNTSRQ
ncbi:MAG: hypothetical protein RI563_05785 [Thiohalophilus sp.]|nr:hypothetical protein [Thiohalophilus sp.]MDR9436368.1 hypothetical protein [Thiohalophilus sp.]